MKQNRKMLHLFMVFVYLWMLILPANDVGAAVATHEPQKFNDGLTSLKAVSIGDNAVANSKSLLDIRSTTKGVLDPRMTAGQATAISSPPEGLRVWDTGNHAPKWYNGTSWLLGATQDGTETWTNKTLTQPVIQSLLGFGSDIWNFASMGGGSFNVVCDSCTQNLSNKAISATNNTITNIANSAISGTAAIARTKIATGTANYVVINSSTGSFSEEANLAISRGGTGAGTAAGGFTALSGIAASGDVVVGTGGGNFEVLPIGSNNQILTVNTAVTGKVQWADNAASPTSSQEVTNCGIGGGVTANTLQIRIKQVDGSTDPASGAGACKIGMRASTAAGGSYVQRSFTAAKLLTLTNGSTLGTANGVQSWIYVYALDTEDGSGTLDLCASTFLFDEGVLQSASTEGGAGGATSGTTLYCGANYASKPIRLIGRITSTQSTAGTWATSPPEWSIVPFRNSVMKALGDMVYGGTGGAPTNLPFGSNGQYLKSAGNAAPAWSFDSVSASKVANYTLTSSDNFVQGSASGGSFTFTLPTAVGISGEVFTLKRTDQTLANSITIATTSSQTIDGVTTRKLMTQYEQYTLVSDGANWHVRNHTYPMGWVSYTPTCSWTTNSTPTGQWRRIGDSIEIRTKVALTGAPDVATLTYTIPSGLTLDTSKMPDAGSADFLYGYGYASVSSGYINTIRLASTTVFEFVLAGVTNTYADQIAFVDKTHPAAFGNGNFHASYLHAPIVNWEN